MDGRMWLFRDMMVASRWLGQLLWMTFIVICSYSSSLRPGAHSHLSVLIKILLDPSSRLFNHGEYAARMCSFLVLMLLQYSWTLLQSKWLLLAGAVNVWVMHLRLSTVFFLAAVLDLNAQSLHTRCCQIAMQHIYVIFKCWDRTSHFILTG